MNQHQEIFSAIPCGVEVLVFGSGSKNWPARDLDLLIRYDPRVIPSGEAHQTIRRLVHLIEECVYAPCHLALLTYEEDQSVEFTSRENCIALKQWIETVFHPSAILAD